MKKKNLKSILILGFALLLMAAVTSCSSKSSIKVAVNVAADTIRILNTDNQVITSVSGQKELEAASLSAGKYTIEVSSAGYLKVKKEITLEKNSKVSESFVLEPDTASLKSELEEAQNLLLGNWSGKFGKSTMTLVLDDMKPGTINGNDEVDGKKRNLTGTYQYKEDKYNLTLNEPGDKKEDGQFILNIDKSGQTAEGTWESFDHKMKYPVKFEKEQGQTVGNKSGATTNGNNTGNVEKQEPILYIIRGTYGSSWKNYNVTSSLNNRVSNGNIYVEVSNRTFGDPDPGKPKTLTVSYKYRGSVYNKILHENMIFRVP
jgi:hypothetical protein